MKQLIDLTSYDLTYIDSEWGDAFNIVAANYYSDSETLGAAISHASVWVESIDGRRYQFDLDWIPEGIQGVIEQVIEDEYFQLDRVHLSGSSDKAESDREADSRNRNNELRLKV